MGAGNSSQGRVYSAAGGPGTDNFTANQGSSKDVKMPEVNIRTITWTRESHGLFDFEVKESERKLFEKKQFKIKGNHRVFRNESDVTAEPSDTS